MTITEITAVAGQAGFTGDDLVTAVAVALAESGGDPNAHGDTGIGSGQGSFGLWQIYADAHPEYGPNFAALYDPQTNANAAYAIYSAAGQSFTPWTTFKSGSYESFTAAAGAAAAVFVTQNPSILLIAGFVLLWMLRKA
jgi:hypothetical protein